MANPNHYFQDSVFWIEVEKIKPNPYQPRREFDEARLKDLADSIKMYGILQPLVVTRREFTKDDGGLGVEYELISGERRLRASKIAGLAQVPALIRAGEDDSKLKLELAIIENLQREDINAVDRARAFDRLVKEFGMKHSQVAEKVGKSREYVSNTLRILALPALMLDAISEGKISEGHTRPLLMLVDRPEEQMTLFKDIMMNKMSVRDAESVARKVAVDRSRKRDWSQTPEIMEMERKFKEVLGTKVSINRSENGGRITIDFFSPDDIRNIFEKITHEQTEVNIPVVGRLATTPTGQAEALSNATPLDIVPDKPEDDRPKEEIVKEENEEIYSIKNFGV
jgi:ParB family transcriptional regulator, chromosome partitioning protein